MREVIADAFRMTDDVWRRHANPWSVYTRFAAIPPLIMAIWSRTWIGLWCLLPIALAGLKRRSRHDRVNCGVGGSPWVGCQAARWA
jgi:hypothetical protein